MPYTDMDASYKIMHSVNGTAHFSAYSQRNKYCVVKSRRVMNYIPVQQAGWSLYSMGGLTCDNMTMSIAC